MTLKTITAKVTPMQEKYIDHWVKKGLAKNRSEALRKILDASMLIEDQSSLTGWTGVNPLNPEKGHALGRSLGNLRAINGVFRTKDGTVIRIMLHENGDNKKYGTRKPDFMIDRGISTGNYVVGKDDVIYEMDKESRILRSRGKIPRAEDVSWHVADIYY